MRAWKNHLRVALAAAALFCGACARENAAPEDERTTDSVVVRDALDRSVRLKVPARKLLVTGKAPFAIEHALYLLPTVREQCEVVLSAGKGGASRATPKRFLEALGAAAGSGGAMAFSEGNAEEILSRGPDAVLLKASSRLFGKSLEGLGTPEVYLSLESAGEYLRDLTTLGQLVGAEDEAAAAWEYYREILLRAGDWRAAAAASGEKTPRVLLVQWNASRGSRACRVPPPDWMQTWMVREAGGEPVWTDGVAPGQWGVLNPEEALAWDPDVVLVASYAESADAAVDALRADPVWAGLRAFREGRVYAFPGDFLSWDQPDTRWGLGLLWTASRLHPAVARVDMEAELARFYALYGLGPDWVAAEARPLVREDIAPLAVPGE